MGTRKLTAIFSLIIILGLLNFLILNLPQGLVLLTSLAAAVIYLTYERTLDIFETGLSTAVFIFTGLVISVITKNIETDICRTARAIEDLNGGNPLPEQQACRSVFEIWVDFLSSNPYNAWEFWSISLAASVGSIQVYIKVREWRDQEQN